MNKYEEWMNAKKELIALQERERELRAAICKEELAGVLEGSRTVMRDGYKVVSTAVLNRVLDKEVLNTIWEDLTWEEQQAVEWVPKLKIREYKPIEEVGGKLLEAVTIKPGMSQLKIEV